MGIIAENSEFFKGRREIIDSFEDEQKKLRNVVAGKNFTKLPGFLFEYATKLELSTKLKLSEMNYKITAAAIERELKQTGHDYNIAYKDARIAFELEKQTLLTALDQELAYLKYTQALSEEEVDRQLIELEIRRLILVTTKTEIDLEMEGLKQELERTKLLPMDKEVELINQKVITANKKLEVIPYIEAVIAAQQEILDAEEANIPYLQEEVEQKGLLIDKKLEFIPYLVLKTEKLAELYRAIIAEIAWKELTLATSLRIVEQKQDIIDEEVDLIEARKAVEDLRKSLIEAKNDLKNLGLDWKKEILQKEITNIDLLSTENSVANTSIINNDSAVASDENFTLDHIERLRREKNEETTELETDSDRNRIRAVAAYEDEATAETGRIAAAADITTNLTHILGTG